jgi:hypothetical protein
MEMTDEDGMTEGRNDGTLEELPEGIRALAKEINAPPPTPRAEIWARIQTARGGKTAGPKAGEQDDLASRRAARSRSVVPSFRRSVLAWATGIAAILLIGIALGRNSVTNAPAGGQSTISALPDSTMSAEKRTVAYTVAAVQHLTRVETFLTTLRTAPGQQYAGQARELLSSTRLLMEAKDMDPRLRKLMVDLEDILVQIVQYDVNRSREDLDLITDGLEERQVLPRLHSAIPAGPARAL